MNTVTLTSTANVQIEDLSKRFGKVTALDRVSLSFPRGSIIGLVGRNGAGKTTLLRHVSGALIPSQGQVTTFGCPAAELGAAELNRLGALDQEIRLLEWMSVEQHLRYVAGFYDRWDRDLERDLVARLELDTKPRVSSLSGGDLQKLALLLALCHRPELILLDEPVSAFDPVVRERMLQYLLAAVRDEHTTIVISSHALRDVAQIVDRVVVLENGRVKVDGAADDIQERYAEWIVATSGPAGSQDTRHFSEPFIVHCSQNGSQIRLVVRDAHEQLQAFRERHRVEVLARPIKLETLLLSLLEES